jgi:hypothetical protein
MKRCARQIAPKTRRSHRVRTPAAAAPQAPALTGLPAAPTLDPMRRRAGSGRRWALGAGLWLSLLTGCGDRPLDLAPGGDPGTGLPLDSDGDGLCDVTEAEVATRPDQIDSDADGLPDLVEVIFGYDPRDADDPVGSHVGVLEGAPGASAELSVRITVDGTGDSHGGAFEAQASLDAEDRTAADFLQASTAVSADPPDNVRRIERDNERFAAVLGETRLSFALQFAYPQADPVGCSQAYPFRYVVKADSGPSIAAQYYLLIVVPPDSAGGPESFCIPSACI